MLDFGPHSQADLTNVLLTTTKTEGKTPTHALGQEPHLYRPKRNSNSVTQEGNHGGQTEGGGHSTPPPRIPDYLI